MPSRRRSIISLFALSLLLVAFFPSPAAVARTRKPKAPVYHDTVITRVDAHSIAIKENRISKSYKIDQDTVITLKDQPAKVSALSSGMTVSVTAGMDPTVAARIAASDPPQH